MRKVNQRRRAGDALGASLNGKDSSVDFARSLHVVVLVTMTYVCETLIFLGKTR